MTAPNLQETKTQQNHRTLKRQSQDSNMNADSAFPCNILPFWKEVIYLKETARMMADLEIEPGLLLCSLMPVSLHPVIVRGAQMGFKPVVFAPKITLQVTKPSSLPYKDMSKYLSPFCSLNKNQKYQNLQISNYVINYSNYIEN